MRHIEVERCEIDVAKHRATTFVLNSIGRRDPCEGGDEHLVTRLNTETPHRDVEGRGARAGCDRMRNADERSELPFELRHLGALNDPTRLQGLPDGLEFLGPEPGTCDRKVVALVQHGIVAKRSRRVGSRTVRQRHLPPPCRVDAIR